MPRKLTWNEKFGLSGWGYSECAWLFQVPSVPAGKPSEEILRTPELQIDSEFTLHVCPKYPKRES